MNYASLRIRIKKFKIMKIVVTSLMALLLCTSAFAQERRIAKKALQDYTPEQLATLKTKKMVLSLELSQSQENKIYNILLEEIKARKEKKIKKEDFKNLTSDQRYDMKMKRLDAQIALQEKIKKILNEEQYTQWKKTRHVNKMQAKRKILKRMAHKKHKKAQGK